MEKITTVDAYITAEERPDVRERMAAMRKLIRETAPGAEEKISWGMATYMLHGSLVHFASQKHHIGFYPGVECMEAFAQKLSDYKTSKGAVQFPNTKPVPYALVEEMVRYQVENNTARYNEKMQAKRDGSAAD